MDNTEKYISQLREKLTEYFSHDATGHGIDHLERVLKYALLLQSREGGDREVIAVSAYVHDIHRILSDTQGKYVSPKDSIPTVKEFLLPLGLPQETLEHIIYAIIHHEEYAFGKDKVSVTDKESLILQDADNLDAIGAIGIVRSFRYGASHNMQDYDCSQPFYRSEYTESIDDKSTLHHLYNKPCRLGKYLNTQSAKQIAKEKTRLVKQFVKLYLKEFNCDF